MNEEDLKKIESMIARQVGTFAEDIQHKFDVLVEGHQMLAEKLDRSEKRLDARIDCVVRKLDAVAAQGDMMAAKLDAVAVQGDKTAAKLETLAAKLDSIAADLKAHRADTEAHPPVYRVKE